MDGNGVNFLLHDDWVRNFDWNFDWVWDFNFLNYGDFDNFIFRDFLVVVFMDCVDGNFNTSDVMFTAAATTAETSWSSGSCRHKAGKDCQTKS